MPGLLKIGRTSTSVEDRVRQLSAATSTPYPFSIVASWYVTDSIKGERLLHERLSEHRANRKREFFTLDASRAKKLAIDTLCEAELLTEQQKAKSVGPVREFVPVLGYAAADQLSWWKSGG